VVLTSEQHEALDGLVRRAPKAYLRERAACIIKVGAGEIAAQVARDGLLLPRDPDTVYAWLDRFEREGIGGLKIRPGRGRKPAFPPREPDR